MAEAGLTGFKDITAGKFVDGRYVYGDGSSLDLSNPSAGRKMYVADIPEPSRFHELNRLQNKHNLEIIGKDKQIADLNTNSSSKWFGKGGYINTGTEVVNAASNISQGWAAIEGAGLAKREFNRAVDEGNANLYNAGTASNANAMNATNVGLTLAGATLTDAEKDAARKKTESNYMKTKI